MRGGISQGKNGEGGGEDGDRVFAHLLLIPPSFRAVTTAFA
jgi:hypothetical protein